MVKYYFFISQKDINAERFNAALVSSYKNIFSITFFDGRSGYVLSDEHLYDYLESLIPVIMSDTDNSYQFLMSHDDSQVSRTAMKKMTKSRGVHLSTMADILLNLALENDFELISLAKRQYAAISRPLMVTAEMFISCGLNASLAAKKLYVHRNTFAYRLNQFIEATNLDIRDFHNALFFNIFTKLISNSRIQ
ncbi:MAG: helix-turn-helix domain-containing protein [Bacilli bacterium]|jgi:hypothetical protein|nr:PucR family transcriptional regulator [Erysipelotrichaceae bacterium]HNY74043.1 helix-turn-helix domain-containing protein [Bacilli bacterium]HOH67713.1 helix-turn-helix domain-containing protein [Bacilli bacterium]HPM07565.1 helix-turn-helix domain-containing protein [Bacilli bacterium]HPY37871.1 helix-turn-helix domain-containing protein [Bacilli bacterium]